MVSVGPANSVGIRSVRIKKRKGKRVLLTNLSGVGFGRRLGCCGIALGAGLGGCSFFGGEVFELLLWCCGHGLRGVLRG